MTSRNRATPDETLAVFRRTSPPCTPLTASEVAEELDCTRRSAYDKLTRLADRGDLRTKKIGARGRVWWLDPSATDASRSDGPLPASRSRSDEQFEALVNAVEDYAIYMLDADGRVTSWNAGAERLKGYDREAILGEHVSVFYTDEDRAAHVPEENLARAVAEGAVEDEGWRVRADGSRFRAHVTVTAIRDDGGDVAGFAKVTRDVTDRRERERTLREEKAFTESLLDNQRDVVYAFDADGKTRRWNDRLVEVTGYSEETIATMQPLEFVAEGDRERVEDAVHRILAHGESTTVEASLVTADGTAIPYEFSGAPIYDEDGSVVGLTGVGRDVSDRVDRERELRRERNVVERVFESSPVALMVADADGTLRRANARAETVLGVTADGERSAATLDVRDSDGDPLSFEATPIGRTVTTGEPVTDREVQIVVDDERRWLSVTTAPIVGEDGDLDQVVVGADDVTRLKRQADRLERQRDELERELGEMFERIDDAFYAVDDEFRFTYVNERAEVLLQRPAAELLGESVWERYPEAAETDAWDAFHTALDEQEPTSYEVFFPPLGFWVEANVYPSESGLSVYFRDVTQRKERERELEQYERIVETVGDGVYAIDDDSRFVMANEAFCEMVGWEREDLIGRYATTVYDDDIAPEAADRAAEVATGDADVAVLEFDLHTKSGETIPVESRFGPFPYGDGYGRCGVVRDVTDRIERERALRKSEQRYRTLAEHFPNGLVGLFDEDLRYTLVEGGAFDDLSIDADDLEGKRVEDVYDDETAETLVPRFGGVFDGESSVFEMYFEDREYQVWTLPVTDDDGTVFAGMVMSQEVTERNERERTLERQREQLAALNNLNAVVRDVTDAVIDQSTREEIERTVCEALAALDSYAFAWIGEVDGASGTIRPLAAAGIDGYLDDVTVSIDPDDPTGEGPTGRAVRTRTTQVSHDVHDDPEYGSWRDHAVEHGIRSSAAIPIRHEETFYGVLNVYADRSHAFVGEDREMVEQIGEVVGHAISAVERKRALMSDEVVEVDFRIENLFDVLDVAVETGGTVTIDQVVPVTDDEFRLYGTATDDAVDAVTALVESLPSWEEVTVHSDGDPVKFDLRVTEPPVLSAIASLGGYVDGAVIDDGDFRMTLHLAPNVDVRRVIDVVQETYPTAEMTKRRQVTRFPDAPDRVQRILTEELTDRQRTALESAFHAGFFEWPRGSSGEEIADGLDISAPTFHQHLRKAERKIFDSLLGSTAENAA